MKTNILILIATALLTFSIAITYHTHKEYSKPKQQYIYYTDSTQVIVSGKDLQIVVNHVNK